MQETRSNYASLVLEARNRIFPQAKRREVAMAPLTMPAPFNTVHVITGVRRCGKTFYVFQLMKDLMEAGTDPERIFYFDFSDDRLSPQTDETLDNAVNEYWRQVPKARAEGCYLFLDEIQDCLNWQGFCRRVAEHEKVTLVITGSSSKLSADEIATNFRGRSLECPMQPLSFREFCAFRGIPVPDAGEIATVGAVSPAMQTLLEGAYDDYLTVGGFPGVQELAPPERIRTLQTYVRDVVTRDVAERMGRADLSLANQTALFALRNTACELSINTLTEGFKALGFRTSWETVNELVRLFGQAGLVSLLPEFSTALNPASTATSKAYAADPGMAFAVARANQEDVGKRLETAVYLELRRRSMGFRTEALTSYTAPTPRREKVDFLVGDALGTEPYALYQVTADMEAEKTRKRELGSLEVAMRETGIANGTVVTLREQGTASTAAGDIRIVPAWLWSLEA